MHYYTIGDLNNTTLNKQPDSYRQRVRLHTCKLSNDFIERIQLLCDDNLTVPYDAEESRLEEEVEEDVDMQEEQILEEELDLVQGQEPEYEPCQFTRFYSTSDEEALVSYALILDIPGVAVASN
jgi:hypothetical protein